MNETDKKTPFTVPLDAIIGDTTHMTMTKASFQLRGLSVQTFLYSSTRYQGRKKPTVIAIHGGPAFTHNYIVPLKLLTDYGHDVIFYDQGNFMIFYCIADPLILICR